jgi:hypothetical protein
VLQGLGDEIFVNVLGHFVLQLQLLNVLVFLFVLFLFSLIFAIDFNILEEIEERFFFDLFSLFLGALLLALLLDDFYCDVFAFFPVNLISVTLLNSLVF